MFIFSLLRGVTLLQSPDIDSCFTSFFLVILGKSTDANFGETMVLCK